MRDSTARVKKGAELKQQNQTAKTAADPAVRLKIIYIDNDIFGINLNSCWSRNGRRFTWRCRGKDTSFLLQTDFLGLLSSLSPPNPQWKGLRCKDKMQVRNLGEMGRTHGKEGASEGLWWMGGGGEASLLWHMLGFKYLALNTANTLKDLNILANCNLINWESHVNCVHLSSIGWSVVSLQLPEPGVATLLTPVPDVKPNWCHFNKPLLV